MKGREDTAASPGYGTGSIVNIEAAECRPGDPKPRSFIMKHRVNVISSNTATTQIKRDVN